MSEFKVIETQAELDKIIEGRLARQKETYEKQLSEFEKTQQTNTDLQKALEDAKSSTAEYEKQVSDLNSKVAGYETASLKTKIALQNGLPIESTEFLKGDNEESIQESAEKLKSIAPVGYEPVVPPMKDTEPASAGDEKSNLDRGYRDLAESLDIEGE